MASTEGFTPVSIDEILTKCNKIKDLNNKNSGDYKDSLQLSNSALPYTLQNNSVGCYYHLCILVVKSMISCASGGSASTLLRTLQGRS